MFRVIYYVLIITLFSPFIISYEVFSQENSISDSIEKSSNSFSDSTLIDELIIRTKSNGNSGVNSKVGKSEDGVSYMRFVFALFVVGSMLFAFYLIVKKKYGVATKTSKAGGNLDVLEELVIGAHRLYIVRVSNKVMVLGAAASGLNHIHTFNQDETIDILSSYDEGMDGTTSGKFSDIVNKFLDKYKEK